MNEPLASLQKALYELLNNDSTLSTMVTGIYDFVPQDNTYAYVVLGDQKSKDWSTPQITGYEIECEIICYSNTRGKKQSFEITDRIHTVLNNTKPIIDGPSHVVDLHYSHSKTTRSNDGLIYITTQYFTALIED